MPTLAKRIERWLIGRDDRNDEQDATIAHYQAKIRQDSQVTQSGARLVTHMSGMIKLMAEGHAQK